ncbi:hypothetical protein SKAU_G00136220 [Synaphobranchus kaupii]|uniref:Uncharacterized protein n=1 Tax=Synaphobranchus kaupii TaxID=118154 RepID=A0A9Q1J3J3_SYNKA|nr:hypothetical protein SKAU_G00136220 [Synaphobranchus kaupii]
MAPIMADFLWEEPEPSRPERGRGPSGSQPTVVYNFAGVPSPVFPMPVAGGGEQEDELDEAQEGTDRRPPEQEGAESNVHQSEDREVQDRDNQPGPSGISTVPQLASSSATDRSPESELPGAGGRGARLERAELDRADRGAAGGFGQLYFSDLVTLELGDLYPTNGDSRPRDETDRPITPRDEVDSDDSD